MRKYLKYCLPGSEDLCDLVLEAEHQKFSVHSHYLGSHSLFIKQLIPETAPFTWKDPQVIEDVLQSHSSSCVHALLLGVYNRGNL